MNEIVSKKVGESNTFLLTKKKIIFFHSFFFSFFFLLKIEKNKQQKPIVQKWDGSLSSSGDTSNSPERMFGRKYPAPTADLFATGNGALALIRHTCDGKLGFNMGNGMYYAMRIPKLPDFVQKFSDIVQNIQTCRSAVNGIAELSLKAFRNRWSLWTLDPLIQRLTTPVSNTASNDPFVNGYTFMNSLKDIGTKVKMPSSCKNKDVLV